MQSSYSLIDKARIEYNYGQRIQTVYNSKSSSQKQKKVSQIKEDAEEIIKKAKEEASNIIKNSSEEGFNKGYNKGYNKGFNSGKEDGYNEGHENGYNEGYESGFQEGKTKGEALIQQCEEIYSDIQIEYNEYLKEKKKELIETIIVIAEKLAYQQISLDENVSKIIESAIEDLRYDKDITIKANPRDCEIIKDKISDIKIEACIKADIHIIPDPMMNIGNILVKRENGTLKIGIEEAKNEIIKILKHESEF